MNVIHKLNIAAAHYEGRDIVLQDLLEEAAQTIKTLMEGCDIIDQARLNFLSDLDNIRLSKQSGKGYVITTGYYGNAETLTAPTLREAVDRLKERTVGKED